MCKELKDYLIRLAIRSQQTIEEGEEYLPHCKRKDAFSTRQELLELVKFLEEGIPG